MHARLLTELSASMEDLEPVAEWRVAEESEADHHHWFGRDQPRPKSRHQRNCRTDPPCLSASSVHAGHRLINSNGQWCSPRHLLLLLLLLLHQRILL